MTHASQRFSTILVVAGLVAGGHAAAQPAPQPTSTLATPLWRVPGTGSGTPVVDGDTAYFLSADREVAAVAVATGEVRWRTSTGVTSSDAIFGTTTAGTALAVDGAMVMAGDWDVVGFDRVSGARRWTYQAPKGDGPGLFLGPARDGLVFTGSPGGKAYALDTATGRLRWVTTIVEGNTTSVFRPAIQDRVVAVGYSTFVIPNSGGLAMLDAATGRLLWRTAFPAGREPWQHTNLTGGPVFAGELVFGSAGDGNIYAFDVGTGAVKWALPRLTGTNDGLISATDLDHRAIVRAGRYLIAGSTTSYIVAYDLETREEKWRFFDRLSGSTSFTLSADDRTVYLPYFGGFIIAVDLATGAERWRYGTFTQGYVWAPAPAGDRVLAVGGRAGLVALPVAAEPRQ